MRYIFFLFAVALLPAFALAQGQRHHTQVELVSSVQTVALGQSFWLALRLQSQPQWHTYWQNPGEAGFATKVIWEEIPQGIELADDFLWPAPILYLQDGIVSYVYEGEVFLLLRARAGEGLRAGAELVFNGRADWLECNDSGCWPGGGDISLILRVAPEGEAAEPSAHAGKIAETIDHLPRSLPTAWAAQAHQRAARTYEVTLSPLPENGNENANKSTATAAAPDTTVQPVYFFPVSEGFVAMQAADQRIRRNVDGSLSWSVQVDASVSAPEVIRGVFTAQDSWVQGGEVRSLLVEAAVTQEMTAAATTDGLWTSATTGGLSGRLIGLAFLGGLILNLMPCVFPVLGIKVLGFVQQGGSERRKVVLHGLAFTAGVLISFWLLSGVLIALRAAGAELGWGFQLQSPAFVAGLSVLLLVFGLSLSGLFDVGYGAMGVGGDLAAKSGFKGSFFSGVLATVVATPCAAPFLAPALGAALALAPLSSLIVFTAIGIGLAFPYLLLSAFPALIGWLPKPGAWMETFKQSMAFLLYATVAYLVWTLAGLIAEEWFLNLLIGLVAVAAACWGYGRWLKPGSTTRIRGWLWTILLSAIGGWLIFTPVRPLQWEDWSPARVAELQAQGRPVYVDFTARWCATCQVNKRVVFSSEAVLENFKKDRVALLKADWTDRNAAITTELAKFGRSAVPFNLFYAGKAGSEPLELPEVLTPGSVLEALDAVTSAVKE